jgi:hypothetical protein
MYGSNRMILWLHVTDDFNTLVSCDSIVKISTHVLLNALQHHLLFLLKEHVAFTLVASVIRNALFKICSPGGAMLISRELKHK